MESIEPNWRGLVAFVIAWAVVCLAFLSLTGMFPMRSRPEGTRGSSGALLVIVNLALCLGLAVGSVAFARAEIRWTSAIVMGGLVFLFAPALFQGLRPEWRDSRTGLGLLASVQICALALLVAMRGVRTFALGG